jgi:hypothetical protein
LQNCKTFLTPFQWSISRLDFYQNILNMWNYVRVSSCALIKLPTAEACGAMFIWSISYWFWEHWKFLKLLPLTIGAGVGLLACILYFFRIFPKYAFVIVLIPLFFYLGEIQSLERMTLHRDLSYWNLRTITSFSPMTN